MTLNKIPAKDSTQMHQQDSLAQEAISDLEGDITIIPIHFTNIVRDNIARAISEIEEIFGEDI
jgi:hypothetical protein